MATLFDAFGSRVHREYGAYNATTGTWTCERGSGNATQSTAAKRPAASTTPSAQSCPNFDASSTAAQADYLEIPTLATLPAFNNATHNRMFACIYRRTGVMPHGASIFYRCVDVYGVSILDGKVEACGARANDVADVGVWHRMLVVKNGSGVVTMYIDGVAQTTTGTGQLGQDWRIYSGELGARSNGDYPHGGELARMAFLYDVTTPFSGGDIAAADAVLATYLSAGSSGGPVAFVASAAGVGAASASVRVARRLSATAAGVGAGTAAIRRAAGLSGSAAGIASASSSVRVSRRLQASASGVASTSAAMRRARPLVATSSGIATAQASLRAARRLSATAAGVATTTLAVRVARSLNASAAGVGSTFLALTVSSVSEVLFQASSAGASIATAGLSVSRRLGPVAAGQGDAACTVVVARRLTASATGSASSTAAVSVARGFALNAAGYATAVATLATGLELVPSPADIRVTQRPATDIRVSQSAATLIIVRQRMGLHVGSVNVLRIEFRHWKTRQLTDPSSLQVIVTAPSGTTTTYTLGSSSELTRADDTPAGIFECSIPCTEAKTWSFDVVSVGPVAPGVSSGFFTVNPRRTA